MSGFAGNTRAPGAGKYRFRDLDVGTRSPFGLVEHRVTIALADQIVVYPTIGRLTRRWFQMQRQATENRRGQRHDRSAQQVEYHGLRDYRSGDSPRWIHWRTSARRGELMVKEFEQQNEQDLAILIDPWLPRTKAVAGTAGGPGAGDLVRGDALSGNVPAPGSPARSGLDGPGAGRAARAGLGQAVARTSRATGHDASRRAKGDWRNCSTSCRRPSCARH